MSYKKLALSFLVAVFLFGGMLYVVLTRNDEPEVINEIVIEEVVEVAEVTRPVTIGSSVEGRSIEAYTYGDGANHILIIGGIHGGYEWNSVLLAYEMIDYFEVYGESIPENVTVTIVPSLNPDGVFKLIQKEGRFALADVPDESTLPSGTGRFNANSVDLNRNFDCKWQPESTWRSTPVSAGTAPFSEPEAKALFNFVQTNQIATAVFLHSQSNAVYASECYEGVLPETMTVMNTYANASGYKAIAEFGAYPVTGDAEGWLASIGIPAITVELSTHNAIEWERNLRGISALMSLYASEL